MRNWVKLTAPKTPALMPGLVFLACAKTCEEKRPITAISSTNFNDFI
jgi:hypothetical protein